MSHLGDIGFNMEREEFYERVQQAANEGETIPSANGFYIRWTPGEGVELWVQSDREHNVVGCNPHFNGKSKMRVGLIRALDNPERPLDGSIFCWADPQTAEPELGRFPFAADLPDFDLVVDRLPLREIVEAQVVAFAHEMHCYLDVQAFEIAHKNDLQFTLEPFTPVALPHGVRPDLAAQTDRIQSVVTFNGHIHRLERRENPVTRQPFYWMSVRTLGGMIDVVADPTFTVGKPRLWGVIQGEFWLSARILSPLPSAKKKSIFQRRRSG